MTFEEGYDPYILKLADKIEADDNIRIRKLAEAAWNAGADNRREDPVKPIASAILAEREKTIRECATAARMMDRLEHEWVRDSIWDNITKRVESRILGLLP